MANIASPFADGSVSNDLEQISRLLPIRPGQVLVELGCGRAETTRLLAERFDVVEFQQPIRVDLLRVRG